jgi:hypothetical protein
VDSIGPCDEPIPSTIFATASLLYDDYPALRPSRRALSPDIFPKNLSAIKPPVASSWPGLSRPSTPCFPFTRNKDVDARDKRGHDDVLSVGLPLTPSA